MEYVLVVIALLIGLNFNVILVIYFIRKYLNFIDNEISEIRKDTKYILLTLYEEFNEKE